MLPTSIRGVAYVTFLVTSIFLSEISAEKGRCVMEGPCAENDFGGPMNCYKPRDASLLPEVDHHYYEKLKAVCPYLFENDEKPPLCCSGLQIAQILKNFEVPTALLERCPACYENFKKIFCSFTCSPNQEDFVVVNIKDDSAGQVIHEVSYYLDTDTATEMFTSCQNVQGITSGSTVMEVMCGIHGSNCIPELWLDFMGTSSENGGLSPFQINFHLRKDTFTLSNQVITPLKEKTFRCNETVGSDKPSCICIDCKEACYIPLFTETTQLID